MYTIYINIILVGRDRSHRAPTNNTEGKQVYSHFGRLFQQVARSSRFAWQDSVWCCNVHLRALLQVWYLTFAILNFNCGIIIIGYVGNVYDVGLAVVTSPSQIRVANSSTVSRKNSSLWLARSTESLLLTILKPTAWLNVSIKHFRQRWWIWLMRSRMTGMTIFLQSCSLTEPASSGQLRWHHLKWCIAGKQFIH